METQAILVKWTAVANMETDTGETLHRELDFLTEPEVDEWLASHPEYEKIPVYRG